MSQINELQWSKIYDFLSLCPDMQTTKLTVAVSLTAFIGYYAQVPSGESYQRNMVTGTASTNALPAGVTRISGKICINILPMTQIWKI